MKSARDWCNENAGLLIEPSLVRSIQLDALKEGFRMAAVAIGKYNEQVICEFCATESRKYLLKLREHLTINNP